ncbi:tripartite tricarboxylate transporter TctB family protein [Desulforamulus ruminis]|uniref:DUF1468 domain-containing protein n=1 Tax=Desulforamulus ruminis (strain ATCC 23193 / DSM 2154 / NCIMB 8452 / DL) TaxID=696281 RepID=F6DSW6_DESRL|nr:tripartite tricarboxylate transporter TctB family protein [Desulforamulus ruminis]AEG59960.1 hypothetical protein Desru_1696 [Desulforamulus ruminis DSM 2154]
MTSEGNEVTNAPLWKKTDFIVGLFFLVFSVFVLVESSQMPKTMPGAGFGPGVMPYWLGWGIAGLSVILMVQAFLNKKGGSGEGLFKFSEIFSVGLMFVTLFIYLGLMNTIGFGLDTLLLVTFVARRLGNYAWWKCALLGLITSVVTVYLFRVLLDMPLPVGFLGF